MSAESSLDRQVQHRPRRPKFGFLESDEASRKSNNIREICRRDGLLVPNVP